MASDQLVEARTILRALAEVKRRGAWPLIADLEKVEPDLAEQIMEGLTTLHHQLLDAGVEHKRTREIDRALRELVVVCITALRLSHYELWKRDASMGRLTTLDPTLTNDAPVTPPPDPEPPV